MMSNISDVLNFYKECYAYDLRSVSVKNFFSRTSQHVMVVDNISILKDPKYHHPVSALMGKKAIEDLTLNSKEKAFYVGAIFIQGKMQQLGRTIRVAPPLYIYEAFLEQNFGKFRVSISPDHPIINPVFLDMLRVQNPETTISYEEFAAGLPSGLLGVAEVIKIQTWLGKNFPTLDVSSLDSWYEEHGRLENARFLYKQNSSNNDSRIIAGICAAMVKKQEGSLGVLNELTRLAEIAPRSGSLAALLGNTKAPGSTLSTSKKVNVPFTISERQHKVFHKAAENRFSLVIGPPGTGKSYTIAALAAHMIAEHKTVLIASKNEQAGKVVVNKLEQEGGLKGLVIKAGRKSYKHHLASRIKDILAGIRFAHIPTLEELTESINKITVLESEIAHLRGFLLKREREETEWGEFFARERPKFFDRFKDRWYTYRHSRARKVWDIKSDIDLKNRRKQRFLKALIKKHFQLNTAHALEKHRKDMLHFTESLSSKKTNEAADYLHKSNFSNVLKALPAWVVKAADAHDTLPLEQEIFDILIIDEATQCDVASCLPLIYRAKHVVIVGDPKQLRFISFLSAQREEILRKKYGLEGDKYRDHSILDLFSERLQSQDQLTYLNEHFRSLPDIIAFSNKKFYNESLHLMTETPVTRLHKHIYISQEDGVKDGKGRNELEAAAILRKLKEIVDHESALTKKMASKVGVLSPFRGQVTYLKSLVKSAFTLNQITKHEILIGTPYHFQGEERDVMLLSMVIDKTTNHSSHTYLNRADVFNVSITRARNLQIVYTSVMPEHLKSSLLLYEYLSHIEAPRNPREVEDMEEMDRFTEEVYKTVENWNVDRIYKSYALSGVIVDLVVVNAGKTRCIDLIGYPGAYKKMFSSSEIAMLDRMGHKVFFLPYSEWNLNRELSVESLHEYLFND